MKYFTDLWPSFGYISVERIRPSTDSCWVHEHMGKDGQNTEESDHHAWLDAPLQVA